MGMNRERHENLEEWPYCRESRKEGARPECEAVIGVPSSVENAVRLKVGFSGSLWR